MAVVVVLLSAISTFDDRMEVVNVVLTLSFALEMVMKLVALHPRGYVKDLFNVFDCIVVVVSFIEVGLSPPKIFVGGSTSSRGSVSVLRTLRLLRVFKLARFVRGFLSYAKGNMSCSADLSSPRVCFRLLAGIIVFVLVTYQNMDVVANAVGNGVANTARSGQLWHSLVPVHLYRNTGWPAVVCKLSTLRFKLW